jgi:hypothetical protein
LLFFFEDYFYEVICSGFWYEESDNKFLPSELSSNHPFKKLPKENLIEISHAGLTGHIYQSKFPTDQLQRQAKYCSQSLFGFGIEPNSYSTFILTVKLMERDGNISSSLRGYFGAEIKRFDKILQLDDVVPYVKKEMEEIVDRRNKVNNNGN